MKKSLIILSIIFAILLLNLSISNVYAAENHIVTFVTGTEDILLEPFEVEDGDTINGKGINFWPQREGYAYPEWYTDPDFKNEFDFETKFYEDTTLYAKWIISIDEIRITTELTSLTAGELLPEFDFSSTTEHVTFGNVSWYNEDEDVNVGDIIDGQKEYSLYISAKADDGYTLEGAVVYVNGEEVGEWIAWPLSMGGAEIGGTFFIPIEVNTNTNASQQEEYMVSSDSNSDDSISFTAIKGDTYSFYIKDRKDTTDEELKQIVELMNDPEYTFESLKAQLNKLIGYGNKAAGEDGTLLKLYEIYLTNNGVEVHEVDGGFKLKLKITDDMKGYDSYKLVYIADDGTTEKAIELTKNGEYLEGTLPHLSMYALVGSKKENTTADNNTTTVEETTTKTSNNPKTGDNIITIFSIFAIATLGAFTTIIINKNRKVRKY